MELKTIPILLFVILPVFLIEFSISVLKLDQLLFKLVNKIRLFKCGFQLFVQKFILKKKSELIDYITQIFFIKLLIFVLDQLLRIAQNFKKQEEKIFIEQVFNNQYLAEKILRNLEVPQYFSVRKVNKSFNNACLGVLRKTHRNMKLEFMQCVHGGSVPNQFVVHVNLEPMLLEYVGVFFRFLNKAAGLKVQRIEVVGLWKLNSKPDLARKFHDDIHSKLIGSCQNTVKSLIGLENMSSTCTDCQKIIRTCSEYGPIDIFWMNTDFGGKHFERIVLTDVFLDEFADACIWGSDSKEPCYKRLEDQTSKTNISCETLQICIHEFRDTDKTGESQNHTPIPLEVLEMILKIWKVQKIEIKFICNENFMPYIDTWTQSNYFIGFKFTDPVGDWKVSNFSRKFSNIRLDLSESVQCIQELKLESHAGYENIIANIRKLFQSDKISINFTHWLFYKASDPQKLLENLLRISRLGFHQNFTIDVKLYLNIEKVLEISEDFKALGPLTPSFRNSMKKGNFYFFETQKWIGERNRFVDPVKNFTLNADIFVREGNLEKVSLENLQTTIFMDMFQLERFE